MPRSETGNLNRNKFWKGTAERALCSCSILDLNMYLYKEIISKLLEKDFIPSVLSSGTSAKVLRKIG